MRARSVVGVLALLTTSVTLGAPVQVEEKDKPVLENFLKFARSEAKANTVEHCRSVETPENFCWQELPKLAMSLTAAELTGDVEHLRDFVGGFENLRSILVKGPDGLLSWYGKPIPPLADPAKPDVKIREIQTDFRAIGVLSRFVEIARSNPEWAKEFATNIEAYLDLAQNQLYKHWDDQGYFVDLGEKGGIYKWNKDYIPNKANLTLAHEKQANMIEATLALYRVTQNPEYLKRAAKLGTFLKSCLEFTDGRYTWKYWDPTGDWDKNPDGKLKHWVGAEPKGQWHAATVGSAVALYHHGIVFSEEDIKPFVKTQMEVNWNGDLDDPKFAMTTGTLPKLPGAEKDRFVAPALAPWAPKLEQLLYSGKWQEERVAKAASNSWAGGVLAAEWLRGKYLELPKTRGGKRLYGDFGAKLK